MAMLGIEPGIVSLCVPKIILIAHERRLLADCEDATERVRLPADKKNKACASVCVTPSESLPVSSRTAQSDS